MKNEMIKKLAVVGMLLAAQVVAGQFISISLPIVKIGFSFLPVAITAMLYGPLWGGAAAAMGDILVAVLGPYGWFPPITISAFLTGALYGLFLYRKPAGTLRVFLCVAAQSIFISVFLQTYWLTLLTGKGYLALLSTRVLQNLITIPVDTLCIGLVGYRVVALFQRGGRQPAKV